jgi:hypothetical protein
VGGCSGGWRMCGGCAALVWWVLLDVLLGSLGCVGCFTREGCRYPAPNSLKGMGGVDLLSTQDLASEVDAQHDRNKHQQGSEDDECI